MTANLHYFQGTVEGFRSHLKDCPFCHSLKSMRPYRAGFWGRGITLWKCQKCGKTLKEK